MKYILSLFLIITSYAIAEPKKGSCHCTECTCTEESHCGCYSNSGCDCSGGVCQPKQKKGNQKN